jgi:hypothetical protein
VAAVCRDLEQERDVCVLSGRSCKISEEMKREYLFRPTESVLVRAARWVLADGGRGVMGAGDMLNISPVWSSSTLEPCDSELREFERLKPVGESE